MDYFSPVTLYYQSCTSWYVEEQTYDAVPVECQMSKELPLQRQDHAMALFSLSCLTTGLSNSTGNGGKPLWELNADNSCTWMTSDSIIQCVVMICRGIRKDIKMIGLDTLLCKICSFGWDSFQRLTYCMWLLKGICSVQQDSPPKANISSKVCLQHLFAVEKMVHGCFGAFRCVYHSYVNCTFD